MILYNR